MLSGSIGETSVCAIITSNTRNSNHICDRIVSNMRVYLYENYVLLRIKQKWLLIINLSIGISIKD